MRNSSYKIIFIILLLLFSSGPIISLGLDDRYTRGPPSTRNGSDIVFNATEDEPFEATIGNDIVSGDNVTFSFLDRPPWLEMDNGSLIGIPGNDDVGWTNFTMNITSTTDQLFLNIAINVMNNPPTIIEGSLSLMAWEDQYYESELLLEEEGEKWEVRMRQSGPWNTTWLEVDRTGKVLGTPRNVHVGNWTVNLTLDDMNGGLAFLEWNVNVLNEPPNITVKDYGIVQEWEEKTMDFDCSSEGDGATFYEIVDTNLLVYTLDPVSGKLTFIPGNSPEKQCFLVIKAYDLFGGMDEILEEFDIINSPPILISELPKVFIAGEITSIDLDTNEDHIYGIEFSFKGDWPAFTDLPYTKGSPFLHYGIIRFLPWNMDTGIHSYILEIKDTDLAVSRYFWNFTVMRNGSFVDPVVEMDLLEVTPDVVRLRLDVNRSGQKLGTPPLSPHSSVELYVDSNSFQDQFLISSVNIDPADVGIVELSCSNITGSMEVVLSVQFEHINGTYRTITRSIRFEIPVMVPKDDEGKFFPWGILLLGIIILVFLISVIAMMSIEKTSYAIQLAVLRGGTIDEEPILALVHDRPGIRFRDLLEHSNFSRRDLVSTLIGLEKAGNVRPIHDGFHVRFYPTVGSFVDGPLVLTRHQQRIAGVLMDTRKASIDELSKITGSSRKRLERETSLMELKGIINRKKGRNGPEYFMSSRQKRSFDEWRGRNTI
ncbi:MAG: hypothetical protein ACMUFK_01015 [Thermoplasmatota archaeon]